jgi:hypothetical protein
MITKSIIYEVIDLKFSSSVLLVRNLKPNYHQVVNILFKTMTYYAKVATLNLPYVGKTSKQYFLSISMHHATNLEYLQFFNIIQERKSTTKKIQTILSQCFVNKQNLHFEIDAITTIICTHKIDVEE